MPTPQAQGSRPGNAAARPLACKAWATVAPAGSASVRCHTADGMAWHTLTRSTPASLAIQGLRALGERIDETGGDPVEHRAHHHFERPVGDRKSTRLNSSHVKSSY